MCGRSRSGLPVYTLYMLTMITVIMVNMCSVWAAVLGGVGFTLAYQFVYTFYPLFISFHFILFNLIYNCVTILSDVAFLLYIFAIFDIKIKF